MLNNPCLNNPKYPAQMRFIEEMIRGEVPGVLYGGPRTLIVDTHETKSKPRAAKRVKAIQRALRAAGWEVEAVSKSNVWTWTGETLWSNPCRDPVPTEPKV